MNERVTNEQALAVKNMINGRPFIYADGNDIPADWFAADLLDARTQRDTAWRELREIREAIKADENESTADEVRRFISCHRFTDQQFSDLRKELDAVYKPERAWEVAMMAAVGEDGTRSVVEAINKIKTERDDLLVALKNVLDGNDLAHERGESLSSWPDSDFRRQAKKAIEEASHVD